MNSKQQDNCMIKMHGSSHLGDTTVILQNTHPAFGCMFQSKDDIYYMSKHSKNNTSSNVFTYGERKMLKGLYGTIEQRVGQDSQKPFDMCTICTHRIV